MSRDDRRRGRERDKGDAWIGKRRGGWRVCETVCIDVCVREREKARLCVSVSVCALTSMCESIGTPSTTQTLWETKKISSKSVRGYLQE